ncbi:MAG: diacylglycerol kinase family lipid kinase, partial [Candidatus Poribacteria bacterium]|nr:diacylglycerol kinase family lipid kinase [Candidatus Poribacteria bacterium]
MDDFILIANPISGKGKAKTVAEQAYTALMAEGCNGEIKLTTGTGDATRFALEAVSSGIRWVIVCGGDGTLHEVVNGIATVQGVTLGVLPCGRGNDLATAIGIPRKPQHAIQTLFTGKSKCIDLGYVRSEKGNEHYFTTITTCGYDTEVSRRAAARTTPFSGTASYVYAAIATLFKYKCPFVRIEGDFGTYEGPLLLAATGNTKSYGGGFKIVPNAHFDDGLFDVCII